MARQLGGLGPGHAQATAGGEAPVGCRQLRGLQQPGQLRRPHPQAQQPGRGCRLGRGAAVAQARPQPPAQAGGVQALQRQGRCALADAGDLLVEGLGADAGQAEQQAAAGAGRGVETGPSGRSGVLPVDPLGAQAGIEQPAGHRRELAGRALQPQPPALGRNGQGAQGEFADQGQGAPAAGEQAHQVVAGHVLHHLAAGPGGGAVGPHQADTDQLVAHAQVALAGAAGQAAGHQPAHAAAGAAVRAAAPGPVEGQPLPVVGQLLLQHHQWCARLHRHGEILRAVVQDPVQPRRAQHQRLALLRTRLHRRTPGQPAAAACRQPGGGLPVQVPHQLLQLAGLRTDHGTMVPWPPPPKSSCSTTTPPDPRPCMAVRCCCAGIGPACGGGWSIPPPSCSCWPIPEPWIRWRRRSGCAPSAGSCGRPWPRLRPPAGWGSGCW